MSVYSKSTQFHFDPDCFNSWYAPHPVLPEQLEIIMSTLTHFHLPSPLRKILYLTCKQPTSSVKKRKKPSKSGEKHIAKEKSELSITNVTKSSLVKNEVLEGQNFSAKEEKISNIVQSIQNEFDGSLRICESLKKCLQNIWENEECLITCIKSIVTLIRMSIDKSETSCNVTEILLQWFGQTPQRILQNVEQKGQSWRLREGKMQILLNLEVLSMSKQQKSHTEQLLRQLQFLSLAEGNSSVVLFLSQIIEFYINSIPEILIQCYEELNLPLPEVLCSSDLSSDTLAKSPGISLPSSVHSECNDLLSRPKLKTFKRSSSFMEPRQILIPCRKQTACHRPRASVCRNLFSNTSTPQKVKKSSSEDEVLVPVTPSATVKNKLNNNKQSIVTETPDGKNGIILDCHFKCKNICLVYQYATTKEMQLARATKFYAPGAQSRNWIRATNKLLAEKIRGCKSENFEVKCNSDPTPSQITSFLFSNLQKNSVTPTKSTEQAKSPVFFRSTFKVNKK